MTFQDHCDDLRTRLFPSEDRDGPLGDVPVDASFLRDLLARYGSCRLWDAALRRKLKPFADAYAELLRDGTPDDYDYDTIHIGYLRLAHELLGANAATPPPKEEEPS